MTVVPSDAVPEPVCGDLYSLCTTLCTVSAVPSTCLSLGDSAEAQTLSVARVLCEAT